MIHLFDKELLAILIELIVLAICYLLLIERGKNKKWLDIQKQDRR